MKKEKIDLGRMKWTEEDLRILSEEKAVECIIRMEDAKHRRQTERAKLLALLSVLVLTSAVAVSLVFTKEYHQEGMELLQLMLTAALAFIGGVSMHNHSSTWR